MKTFKEFQNINEAKNIKLNADQESIKDQIESKLDPAQYIADILMAINENMGVIKDLMKILKQNGYK